MNALICIADSDFVIAQVMISDIHHQKAIKIAKDLTNTNASVFYPSTAIIEAATTIQRKYNNPKLAYELLNVYKDPDLQVVSFDHETLIKVSDCFDPKTSKHNTPFDYVVLSLAKIKKADVILSFDDFFKNKGFKTAKSLKL